MRFALKDGELVEAKKGLNGSCNLCGEKLIAKCGNIKIHHWSHKGNTDCDSWGEPESEWHRWWKDNFPKEQQEFVIGCHRADIRTKSRMIIELQNSSISQYDIIERERYYRRMVWLLNGKTLGKNITLILRNDKINFYWKYPVKSFWESKKDIYIDLEHKEKELIDLIWEYEKGGKRKIDTTSSAEYNEYTGNKYWVSGHVDSTESYIKVLKKELKLLEEKGTIFLIKKINKKCPCWGSGELITREEFIERMEDFKTNPIQEYINNLEKKSKEKIFDSRKNKEVIKNGEEKNN